MPVLDGIRFPDQRVGPHAGDGLEHELVGLVVIEKDGGGLGREDRASDLDRGLEQPTMRLLWTQYTRCDCGPEVAHCPPPTFDAVR